MATLTYNPKDMEDNISPKEQQRPIVLAYAALCEHIVHCHKAMSNLEDRLTPVLGPDIPCKPAEEIPTPEGSRLATLMYEQCDKVSVLIERINQLEKRIEI